MLNYVKDGYVVVDYFKGDESTELFDTVIQLTVNENSDSFEYIFNVVNSVTGEPTKLKFDTNVYLNDGKILIIPTSTITYKYIIEKESKIKTFETMDGININNIDSMFIEVNGVKINLEETINGVFKVKTIKCDAPLGVNSKVTLTTGEEIYISGATIEKSIKVDTEQQITLSKISTVDTDGEELTVIPKTVIDTFTSALSTKFEKQETTVEPQTIFHMTHNSDMIIGEMGITKNTLIFDNADFNSMNKEYYKYDIVSTNKLELFENIKMNLTKRQIII